MIGTYLPMSVAACRMISIRRTRSGAVPCEKLRRKTSTPDVRSRWMVSSVLQAGPSVAMILVLLNFSQFILSAAKDLRWRSFDGATCAAAPPEILRFAQDKFKKQ